MRPAPAGLLAACAVLSLLAGCSASGSRGAPLATGAPVPSESVPASPSAPPATTAAATVTATVTATPAVRRPVAKPARDGDVDGDGRPDRVTLTQGRDAETWLVRVATTSTGVRVGQVHTDGSTPTLAGVVDADHDGYAELFVVTAQGASTTFYTPLRLVAGVLREVTIDGHPAQLAGGGSILHGDGFTCRDVAPRVPGWELVVTSGASVDGTTWQGHSTSYRWSGGSLVRIGREDASFPMAGNERRAAAYSTIDCGSLQG